MSTVSTAPVRPAPPAAPKRPEQPARARNGEIQGFRGLAALSTVVFHVWQQYFTYDRDGSHPPVANRYANALVSLEVIDFFFVLSAYLLTLSYAKAAIDGASTRPARTFLFRRAVRIVPLYFLAVAFVWATRNPTLPGEWTDLVRHLTFTQVFDKEQIFYTIGPTWSLSLEIMFYFALVALGPLAVRATRPLKRRSARVAVCAAGCALLYIGPFLWIAVARYGFHVPHTEWPVYFGPQARFGAFAAGMGLAVAAVALGDRGRLGPRSAIVLRLAAAAGLYTLSLTGEKAQDPATVFYHPLSALLWTLLLFSTVHVRRHGRWSAWLTTRWITLVGMASYSLFVWHEPIMLALYRGGLLPPSGQEGFPLAVVVVLAVAVPVALLSYWAIEYPASLLARLKDSRGRPREFYPEAAARP
ncbi:acyltransferase family protein [Streptomyces coffeae]|uniref:Acyltransferase n=1 Tax=Streptomyces coffeae TaxID=621382 RepID=A0ABS1N673_9ACTN|nr:acyltransferase [Streptomyces coffeae]MBL1095577.1 acyltransferase [Streptomyces coffeae]